MVSQKYEVDPIKEHAIKGNNAIMKCQVPSYVADFLTVIEWQSTDGDIYTADSNNYGSHLFRILISCSTDCKIQARHGGNMYGVNST